MHTSAIATRHISFIGAGNMANAIIAGLISSGYSAQHITATCRSSDKQQALQQKYGITTTADNISAVQEAQVVVLCVKPQMMAELCQTFQHIDFSNKLVISIAAGISTKRLCEMLNASPALIRVMPNTPSLVGKGMSGLYANPLASQEDKAFTQALFDAVGKTTWVDEESQINTIIAAAGSAPAYFFLFMQAMQEEAMAQGFDQNTARLLVQQAALGAATMVVENPDLELSTLRLQVTSKGGTTAEAIKTFEQADLSNIVAKAMQAAVERAKVMEQQI